MCMQRWWVGLALAGLLVACSTVPNAQRQQQRQAAYAAAAGAPVPHFSFVTFWSWEPLSDSQLVVYTRPNQAWLLDLDHSCANLQFTNAIGLTSSFGQTWINFDKVLTGRRYLPCRIMRIRPVDVARLKIEQQVQQRMIETRPRTPVAAPARG